MLFQIIRKIAHKESPLPKRAGAGGALSLLHFGWTNERHETPWRNEIDCSPLVKCGWFHINAGLSCNFPISDTHHWMYFGRNGSFLFRPKLRSVDSKLAHQTANQPADLWQILANSARNVYLCSITWNRSTTHKRRRIWSDIKDLLAKLLPSTTHINRHKPFKANWIWPYWLAFWIVIDVNVLVLLATARSGGWCRRKQWSSSSPVEYPAVHPQHTPLFVCSGITLINQVNRSTSI